MSELATTTGHNLPQRNPGASEPHDAPLRDQPETTGDPSVDAVLARLARVDPQLDPASQLPVLSEIHEALQQRLSSTES